MRSSIPYVEALVAARNKNISESRFRAEKYKVIDEYTKDEYAGLKAVTLAMKSMFAKPDEDTKPTSKNIAWRQ